MTQAYGPGFAKLYNLRWGGFATAYAPVVRALYEGTPLGREEHSLLDVCCGTGQFALHFLQHGYQITGLDLSPHMLGHASTNARDFVEAGQATFVEADAADFHLERRFGLVVSLFDALNHLPDAAALRGCFRAAYDALFDGGTFIFDLNTRAGLNRWNGINVQDDAEATVITRGIYDGESRALTRITGFVRGDDGRYERVTETVYNTVFAMHDVRALLLESGCSDVYWARGNDLATPIDDIEAEGRAWFVARK
ncbi:MAG: class I SAM-dependent methyltransferase [Anaerolineae bacterium]|nr:class I SAM-dependent methyltransferase [Anaerolineae bacterium]